MTSFLDKLNGRLGGKAGGPGGRHRHGGGARLADLKAAVNNSEPAKPKEEELAQSQRLDVDVYHSPSEVVVFAMTSGVDPAGFDITLDEENDLLIIRGSRKRPERGNKPKPGETEPEGKFVQQECRWEPFYRKVTLPTEVDAVEAEAVFKKGVLIITLPILKVTEGRKLKVVEKLSSEPPPPPPPPPPAPPKP